MYRWRHTIMLNGNITRWYPHIIRLRFLSGIRYRDNGYIFYPSLDTHTILGINPLMIYGVFILLSSIWKWHFANFNVTSSPEMPSQFVANLFSSPFSKWAIETECWYMIDCREKQMFKHDFSALWLPAEEVIGKGTWEKQSNIFKMCCVSLFANQSDQMLSWKNLARISLSRLTSIGKIEFTTDLVWINSVTPRFPWPLKILLLIKDSIKDIPRKVNI